MTNSLKFFSLFTILTCQSFAQTVIDGNLTDDFSSAMAAVQVNAVNEAGTISATLSDSSGFYSFSGLAEGTYVVSAVAPVNYEVMAPECGYEIVYVDSSGVVAVDFSFAQRTGGVAVDFGTPNGSGGGGNLLAFDGQSFDVTLYASNLLTSGTAPQTLSVSGYWYVPGVDLIYAEASNGNPAGSYAADYMDISFTNYSDGRTEIVMEKTDTPNLNVDGAIATFTFNVSKADAGLLTEGNHNLAFCVESVEVITATATIDSYANAWVGKLLPL